MPDIHTPISEYIKQGIFLILIIAISLFGIKSCRKFQKKRQVVIELSNHAGESAAYEQFYKDTAQQNLLQAMYQMHLGTELGLTPHEIIDKVMQREKGLFSTEKEDDFPIRKSLIRDSLLSNFANCNKLGVFENTSNIDALANGEFPTITKGPATDELIVIRPIINSAILPGVDKLLPNMMISPPHPKKSTTQETMFEQARAKLLVKALSDAELIERSSYKKVIEHYNQTIQPEPAK